MKYQSNAIEGYFTRSDGQYIFARWGRPIAPVVFGVQDKTLVTLKTAIQSLTIIANHEMAETDPELGSNAMFFFFLSWDELLEVKDLDRIVPDLGNLVGRLKSLNANQYRFFRFDESGGIKAVYDPTMPIVSNDKSHALRVRARIDLFRNN